MASRRSPPSGMTARPASRRRAAAADVGSVPRKNADPPRAAQLRPTGSGARELMGAAAPARACRMSSPLVRRRLGAAGAGAIANAW